MEKTLTALYDGQVFRPDTAVDLPPNTRYVLKVLFDSTPDPEGDAWSLLEEMAGSLEAPPDWASEHDHYLYGTPRRGSDDQV